MKKQGYFWQPFPYEISGTALFEVLRVLPRPLFLDSNGRHNDGIDILAADPVAIVRAIGERTTVTQGQEQHDEGNDSPFSILRELLQRYAVTGEASPLPFNGGAIGYFAYDLARRLQPLPQQSVGDIAIPEMDVGIYLWAIVRDRRNRTAYFVAHPQCPKDCHERIMALIEAEHRPERQPFTLIEPFRANQSQQQYTQAYRKIIDYIGAGDCYQVNYAQRFDAAYRGDEWAAYRRLREVTDAPFSAYIESDDYALLSLSPERFLQVTNGQVESKPIKGTRPRSSDPQLDQQHARLLRNSAKDQAENLMIVDLLRNDISKNCALGSVTVPELFEIESYSNVHHLVSTVTGKLAPHRDALNLLQDAFPGGSITGAPKRRAMEIIEELEPQRRSLYCGSIGYIDFNGNMDTNICIRTLICHQQRIYCWGGGGIVADSDVDNEYQESYVKVNNLMSALQTTGNYSS